MVAIILSHNNISMIIAAMNMNISIIYFCLTLTPSYGVQAIFDPFERFVRFIYNDFEYVLVMASVTIVLSSPLDLDCILELISLSFFTIFFA